MHFDYRPTYIHIFRLSHTRPHNPWLLFCWPCRFDLGSGALVLKSPEMVKLNTLHRVVARRFSQDGSLRLDNGQEMTGTSPGTRSSLNLITPLYLGYVADPSITYVTPRYTIDPRVNGGPFENLSKNRHFLSKIFWNKSQLWSSRWIGILKESDFFTFWKSVFLL